jgi:FSR family fosmidomycin resistance protein-like MFS transporter
MTMAVGQVILRRRQPGGRPRACAISVSHLLNDTLQSLIPSIYPLLKGSLHLNFSQIGLITLTLQLTASLLQPLVGMYTDRRPMPYSLVGGMAFSLVGLLLLSVAATLGVILLAAGLMGVGSSIFHPESSRIARMSSGGRTASPSRSFRLAAISVRRSGRCSPRSLSCRTGRRAWPGAR